MSLHKVIYKRFSNKRTERVPSLRNQEIAVIEDDYNNEEEVAKPDFLISHFKQNGDSFISYLCKCFEEKFLSEEEEESESSSAFAAEQLEQ